MRTADCRCFPKCVLELAEVGAVLVSVAVFMFVSSQTICSF